MVLGKPISVSAAANRKVETSHGRVSEETCAVLVQFDNDAFASATASFVAPEGMTNAETRFICTRGGIEMHPGGEDGTVSITLFHQGRSETRSFVNEPSPFVRQAEAFLRAIETRNEGILSNVVDQTLRRRSSWVRQRSLTHPHLSAERRLAPHP